MSEPKPTIYLDKGVYGAISLAAINDYFEICYSEAILLDLISDQSGAREKELRLLNEVGATYLYRESDRIAAAHVDALELMENTNSFELEMMADVYRFFNGGGELNLFEVLQHQLSTFVGTDNELQDMSHILLRGLSSDRALSSLKSHDSRKWQSERQKATRPWTQKDDISLKSALAQIPDLNQLKEFFPESLDKPQQIHLAALLLGILGLGSDKGITSPIDDRSRKAARNGYIDALHIMFGLHCHVFLTTDKATLRRFRLLRDFWGLDIACGLVSNQPA